MIFGYCERGLSDHLLAEPANVISNAAFLAAAAAAWTIARRTEGACSDALVRILAALAVAIALGSAWFHTHPTAVSRLGDVIPISLFVAICFAWSARRLAAFSRSTTAALLLALGLASALAAGVTCPSVLAGATSGPAACLNGSIAYLPALAALVSMTGLLRRRRHPAAHCFIAASAAFTLAILARSLDVALCGGTRMAAHAYGLHWLWHLLAAAALYFLLRAAIEHRTAEPTRT